MAEDKKNSNPAGAFVFPIIQEQIPCCGGSGNTPPAALNTPRPDQSFVSGSIATPAGQLPTVSSVLTRQDRWGTIKARFNVGRLGYAIDPGLYALGNPGDASPVLVSANYKMSFDYLRQALPGRDAWILVLDTKGINVWCAAGKGTFGTQELIHRIETSGLKLVVSHRKMILPQLGAPGVAAHQVKQFTGFRVHYGPVRASDLPAYLDAGLKPRADMRIMTFPLKERAVLIPVELTQTVKPFLMICAALLVLAGILGPEGFTMNLISHGFFAVGALVLAVLAGAVLQPLLLPWLPGRAFSVKGLIIGGLLALGMIYFSGINLQLWPGRLEALSWMLIIAAVSAYLAMNFTGCSTYTSLSGVKKEMRLALPLEIASGALGLAFWITSLVLA